MPHYTHRGRSSSSSSSSSHSPAPKHRSRSPRNSDSVHKSTTASSRRSGDRRRGSRSYTPSRRHSPPRRRSPSRQDLRRQNSYHSSRRSPSLRRRSSPTRRRTRSVSPGYRRSSRSPVRRRSPSPRSKYRGSSPPRASRRSPPRGRSPRHGESQRGQGESSRTYPAPVGGSASTSRPEAAPPAVPSVTPQQILEPVQPRQEWIPGLDIEPEPVHPTAASSTAAALHSSKPEPARREDNRDKLVEAGDGYSQSHGRNARDQPSRSSRDSRETRDSPRNTREQRDGPRDNGRDLRDAPQHDSYRKENDSNRTQVANDRARSERSPQFTQSRSQSHLSPVGRQLEAERDYNWVHGSRSEPNRPAPSADPVRVSVNVPASPGDMDMRRDRSTTAPWEKKRQDQDNIRSQREAERQHAESHSREPDHHPRTEPQVKLHTDSNFMPSSASAATSRGSLSNRFGAGTENAEPFYPTENITVGIQRNLKDGDEELPVKHHFVEAEVIVPRRKDEGVAPLSLREEFVTREEEVEERRIVKVEAPKPSRTGSRHENFEVRREPFSSKPQSLSERWKERDSRRVDDSRSAHHRENSREDRKEGYRSQDDAHYVGSARDERNVRNRSREDDRRRSPPRDERRVSDSGRSRSQRHESDFHREDDTSWKRGRSRIGERSDSRGHRLPGDVEDFSKREDKYAYEEWKDKPEMIPKGSSYYEHDNRDTYVATSRGGWGTRPFRGRGNFRGRGRGFTPFRGRGTYRGWSFRGRPFTRGYNRGGVANNWRPKGSDGEREWKHDKFAEIHEDNKDKDERPSSTTEK